MIRAAASDRSMTVLAKGPLSFTTDYDARAVVEVEHAKDRSRKAGFYGPPEFLFVVRSPTRLFSCH